MVPRMRLVSWIVPALVLGCSSSAGTKRAQDPKPNPAPATALPDPGGVGFDSKNLVKLSLLSNVSRVGANGTFTIAARFQMQPGWHIYWINPGESGLPTEVDFKLPSGFSAAAPRFPGPHSFKTGTIQNYGYSKVVLVSAKVKAPQLVTGQKIPISASARWLACRESCVRGKAIAVLELAAATQFDLPGPANQVVIAAHENRLPRPWSELDATTRWREGASGAELIIELGGERSGAKLEFFPSEANQLTLQSQTAGPGHIIVRFKKSETRARGLLRVEHSGTERYYSLDSGRTK